MEHVPTDNLGTHTTPGNTIEKTNAKTQQVPERVLATGSGRRDVWKIADAVVTQELRANWAKFTGPKGESSFSACIESHTTNVDAQRVWNLIS